MVRKRNVYIRGVYANIYEEFRKNVHNRFGKKQGRLPDGELGGTVGHVLSMLMEGYNKGIYDAPVERKHAKKEQVRQKGIRMLVERQRSMPDVPLTKGDVEEVVRSAAYSYGFFDERTIRQHTHFFLKEYCEPDPDDILVLRIKPKVLAKVELEKKWTGGGG